MVVRSMKGEGNMKRMTEMSRQEMIDELLEADLRFYMNHMTVTGRAEAYRTVVLQKLKALDEDELEILIRDKRTDETIYGYYADAFGIPPDDSSFLDLPCDSDCGRDCTMTIDHGKRLLADAKKASPDAQRKVA